MKPYKSVENMVKKWVTLWLALLSGCGPQASLVNEIVLPPTIETRGKADENMLSIGFGYGNSHFEPQTSANVTVEVDGSSVAFLHFKRKLPVDLLLSTGGGSHHAELRSYPIKKIPFLGFGIGGWRPSAGSLHPFFTLWLNSSFDSFSAYIAARLLYTAVHTLLSYTDPSRRYHEEEATWKGRATALTLGVNHCPSRNAGFVTEVTLFDIQRGLKSYRWGEDRPYLMHMPVHPTRAFIGAYLRYW